MAGTKVLTRDRSERLRQIFNDGISQKIEALEDLAAEKTDAPLAEQEYISEELEEARQDAYDFGVQAAAVSNLGVAYRSGILIGGEEANHYSFVCSKESGYSEESVRQAANDLVENYAKLGFESMVAESKQNGELMIEVAPKVPAEFQGRDVLTMESDELESARNMTRTRRANSEVPSSHPEKISASILQNQMAGQVFAGG